LGQAARARGSPAGHRISFHHDHVLRDLGKHFDEANAALESIVGWRTKRRIRGKLLPGEVDGIDAGLRNQRRSAPLETASVKARGGRTLKIPTIEEMLRIKAFLIVERNATRDYLDVAALSHHLGKPRSVTAIEPMRYLYAEFAGEAGDIPPWNDWRAVESQCRSVALEMLKKAPARPAGTDGKDGHGGAI
jgi:hypothetical protein